MMSEEARSVMAGSDFVEVQHNVEHLGRMRGRNEVMAYHQIV